MDTVLLLVLGSSAFGAASTLVAQVADGSVQQWASVGSMTAVVGVLVLVAKMLVSGDLVSRKTKEIEEELLRLLRTVNSTAATQAEDASHLRLLVRESHEREMEYIRLFREAPPYEHRDDDN